MDVYPGYQRWKGWTNRPFGICPHESAVYFSEELRSSGIGTVAGMTVVEIGFGNGEFASWSSAAGARYVGTELIEQLIERGLESGFDMHGTQPLDSFLAEDSVDLIVAFDVLEHLTWKDLRGLLAQGRRVLKPSGRLIARVPSGDSPFARAIQHGDATHCSSLGSAMIEQLASDVGFRVHAVREPAFPLWGLGFKAFARRAAVAGIRRIAYPVLTRAFMGGDHFVLTPNMVFVLVKL